ncbi:MAG: protease HtpX [Nitrospirales bacterium]
MKKFKAIGLLLVANVLIFITLSISFTVLADFVLPSFGINLHQYINQADLIFALAIGFGGAFASLALSKYIARMMINGNQITHPNTQAERFVYETVQRISEKLQITMPEVWIYESPDPNAFATGPTRNKSMVAVSTGLLNNLNEGEVRAVLAHEMGHVYNGDMFTTTVLAGLMNTFVFLISRMVYRQLAERNAALGFAAYIFLQIILSFLAMIPISWWSRRREFAADRFAANTVGTEYMISALQSIDRWVQRAQFEYSSQDALATMKISGQTRGFMQLFATHPPIDDRVAALRQL